MESDAQHLALNTGALMPRVGLGTWKALPGEVENAVTYALVDAGYRHLDCAAVYGNEEEVGAALGSVFKSGKVAREEVFVTSKLWNVAHRKGDVRAACEKTLRDLGLDYLDLYLMHWGMATSESQRAVDENGVLKLEKIPVRETWEAMEELVRAGLVKAIGVANFNVQLLVDLMSYASVTPTVLQVELHLYLQQSRFVEFCQYRGITVTAYSPLGSPGNYKEKGLPLLVEDPVVVGIAQAHEKSPAQVLIRWGIQRNTIVIPKSVHPQRIKENIEVFDFELSKAEMDALHALERNLRFVDPYEWGKIPYFS